jgi:hypothetical protein
MGELLKAGEAVFSELKNLCVWNKTNGGMGSFYRSKHELVFVFKVGTAPHTNTFGLGDTGRYRTNVWDYAGINTFRADRDEELSMHPTVKPVALVADAIKDCSRRGEIVVDPFAGSGTTLTLPRRPAAGHAWSSLMPPIVIRSSSGSKSSQGNRPVSALRVRALRTSSTSARRRRVQSSPLGRISDECYHEPGTSP